jgi:hypothetical protein
MGNTRKQLYFRRQRYPTITCPICNSYEPDTWLHVLLTCRHQHIHSLHVKRHNKAEWGMRKLLILSEKSRCYTLMNVGTFNNNPQENTIPTGYYRVYAELKDAIVMPDLGPTSFALKGYLIKINHPQILIKILPYNSLNSHNVMTDSHRKHSKLKLTNTDP